MYFYHFLFWLFSEWFYAFKTVDLSKFFVWWTTAGHWDHPLLQPCQTQTAVLSHLYMVSSSVVGMISPVVWQYYLCKLWYPCLKGWRVTGSSPQRDWGLQQQGWWGSNVALIEEFSTICFTPAATGGNMMSSPVSQSHVHTQTHQRCVLLGHNYTQVQCKELLRFWGHQSTLVKCFLSTVFDVTFKDEMTCCYNTKTQLFTFLIGHFWASFNPKVQTELVKIKLF